ncbi:hypothetical protein ACEWY4_022466 [Coilia grayii]|uniref:L27-N domain-containing protein n=1 Tax=Coilia grayii TaxID=363190 RepID=A0ABD1J639_9TELE
MMTSHMNGYIMDDFTSGSRSTPYDRAGTSFGVSDWGYTADSMPPSTHAHAEPSRCSAQMRRIQNYQEELRRKREEEGRLRQVQASGSMTSSPHLKKLSQDPCPKVGIDNPTFEPSETDWRESKLAACSHDAAGPVEPPGDSAHPSELDDLLLSLQQVDGYLDGDDQSQEDLRLVMQMLRSADFQTAFQLHCSIALGMQPISPPFPLTAQASRLCQEVC